MTSWMGFIEFFTVLAFVGAWFILEMVCKRLDKRREAERANEHDKPST